MLLVLERITLHKDKINSYQMPSLPYKKEKPQLSACASCLLHSMYYHYLGHIFRCQDQDQDKNPYLTLQGTTPLIKTKSQSGERK